MPYWVELMDMAKPGDAIFGKGLVPGTVPCLRDFITKKWHRQVKKGLGIKKDMYTLKHLNLDETAEILDIKQSAKMAGHTSPVITIRHYALGEKGRQNERLKQVNNKFAG